MSTLEPQPRYYAKSTDELGSAQPTASGETIVNNYYTDANLNNAQDSNPETDIRQAEQAGAVVTDPPHDRFWGGYSGYFRDPDDHLWEIAWNPQ
ncbi:VOC family protein, partial [Phyllobacterium brassicacearum]|uniref:VOC family protein n=1 Tax=Phyllobacterium brassicacearum TaxID=314235 RepID=UPI003CCA1A35